MDNNEEFTDIQAELKEIDNNLVKVDLELRDLISKVKILRRKRLDLCIKKYEFIQKIKPYLIHIE